MSLKQYQHGRLSQVWYWPKFAPKLAKALKLGGVTLTIRTKLLLLIAALMLIPFMGYTYVNQMRAFMLRGQETALKLTASAISTVLHDRAELFSPETGIPDVIGSDYDLFAYQMPAYIQLNGASDDWLSLLQRLRLFDSEPGNFCDASFTPREFRFNHVLGYRGQYFFALFDVADSQIVYHDADLSAFDSSDQIRITIQDPLGIVRRYLLVAEQPGRMRAYLMDAEWRNRLGAEPIDEFAAVLKSSDDGYVVELRFPRYLINSNTGLRFSVVDVDDPQTRQIDATISTSPSLTEEGFSRVRINSPELSSILRGIDRPVAKITILDAEQQVRAIVGRLYRIPELKPVAAEAQTIRRRINNALDWVANLIIPPPVSDFVDIPDTVEARTEEVFKSVIAGTAQVQRRPTIDGKAEVLTVAEPIFLGDTVLGAVVVEQSSGEILAIQHRLLRNLTLVTLGVFTFVALALLYFAWRLTHRIRLLRNAADRCISPEGRVLQEHIGTDTQIGDEIGDLARSMSGMLGRLSQYTRYLEAMPDTLAHEMSNPLNVVNSSLDNLQKEIVETKNSKYMQRAMNGINRLGTIMGNLTEAANLEEAIRAEQPELFDLTGLVSSYIEGYRQSLPNREFTLNVDAHPLYIHGVPDHIAQMLDKLVDNAVDFGDPATPIVVSLFEEDGKAKLSVANDGPGIPQHLGARLFEPMVSVRHKNAKQSHLGLGLYIVRLIAEVHRGSVQASSRYEEDEGAGQGALITITIPLADH